ncbi:hypothetical protein [Spirosoma gilvum]
MNKLSTFFHSLLVAFAMGACTHTPDDVTPSPVSSTPSDGTPAPTGEAVTSVGVPTGPIVTATIGSAGGTIESTDKRIRVEIPAGALSASQTISVQALDHNYCPAGVGTSFQLLPHGLTFAKPAKLTFQYTEQDVNGSAPELLRIAYQNPQNSWQTAAIKDIDTTAKTVTVQTTHFSNWSLFKSIWINPQQEVLGPGGSISLLVLHTVSPNSGESGGLFVPLPALLEEKLISKWTLLGEGNLIHQALNRATYNAPDEIPNTNPAAISVNLNLSFTLNGVLFNDIRFISNVYVIKEGISVRIGNSGWQSFTGGVNFASSQNIMEGKNGTDYLVVSWPGEATGTYRWSKDEQVSFRMTNGKRLYSSLYGKAPSVSGGKLQVAGSDGQWIYGTFTLQPAGWYDLSQTSTPIGTADVQGVFRIKKAY